jgi:phosphoacetylglucosamine mutase
MLEAAWEGHATSFANAETTDDFIQVVEAFVKSAKIDMSKPSRVVYGCDTRPSGPALVAALEDGLNAVGVQSRNAGVTTTPILHYLVRSINTKGTNEAYGEDSEEGYFTKLSTAFKKLSVRKQYDQYSHITKVITGRKTAAAASHRGLR